MINKISKIKEFGIYKDFSWGNSLESFAEKNIIYGWNYSGKTTLSRIFSSIRDRKIHNKYEKGSFNISYSHNTDIKEIDQAALEEFPFEIRVFNSDFIQDNLKWETSKVLNGISFDVGENVKIRDQINNNIEKVKRINKICDRFKPLLGEFNNIDKKISDEAKRIKNDVFNSTIEFTRNHFLKIKDKVGSNLNNHIIVDQKELAKLKRSSIANNDKSNIPNFDFTLSMEALYNSVSDLLKEEPTPSDVVDILEKDNQLYQWVRQGISLHTLEKKKEKCAFCDNNVREDRLQMLNNYFSNAAAKLRTKIETCKKSIASEIDGVQKLKPSYSKNDFSETCQDEYEIIVSTLGPIKEKYLNCLAELMGKLENKLQNNLFTSIEIEPFNVHNVKELNVWFQSISELIKTHNEVVSNFQAEQKQSREKLQNHHVAMFLNNENYYFKEKTKIKTETRIHKLTNMSNSLQEQNIGLEAQLKSVVAGKSKLNNFIGVFLNRDDILIDVTQDDKFILKRGNEIAENLSEGEKTAISFSYFLVSLESLNIERLKETIVFIDDPISSLDSNHISQIYSLINAFFFRQNIDPTNPEAYVNCFKQLFISTHNFEFFSFLKDSNRLNKNGNKSCRYYFIKRVENTKSQIQNMPFSLKQHKSEYIYLFNILYKFYSDGCSEQNENLILIPNAIRRFLEIYTLIRLPGSTQEVDYRLKHLFRETNQLKTLHHFSHFTSFEQVTKHDELLMNLPAAMNELIQLLESDQEHFESLKSAVQH